MNQTTVETSYSNGQMVWTYIFLSVVLGFIVINNGLILTAVLSQRRLQSQMNVVILGSLSLAQLLGSFLATPISAVLVRDGNQSGSRFKFSRVVITFCGVVSQLHLMFLCVDRCFALLDTMLYGNLKRRTVIVFVVVSWFLSVLASVLSILDFKNYPVFIVITFFVAPLLVDALGYSLIYRTSCRIGGQNQITTLWRKDFRLAKSFAIFTFLFTLLWLPYLVTILLHDHCASCDTSSSHLLLGVLHCQLLSLAFSSLVYYCGSLDFRLAFKHIGKELRNFMCERNGHRDDITLQNSPSSAQSINWKRKSSKREEVVNQVNVAMFLNGEGEGAQRSNLRKSVSQLSGGRDDPSMATKEEVYIVPFDQARRFSFDENEQEEDLRSGKATNEMSAFDILKLEEDAMKELQSAIGFHDIELVPYDQSY